jgi:hypothetical protein
VGSGLAFHAGTWLLMGIWQFCLSFCAVYFVFLEWPLTKGAPLPERGQAPDGRARVVVGALAALLLAGVVGRLHFWPLGDFMTYSTYQDYRDQVDITHCEHVEANGNASPCYGGTAALGAQVVVRLLPNERLEGAVRRWLDDQVAKVPPQQRRALIGRTVRLHVRSFPVVDGAITIKHDTLTLAQ